MIHLLNDLCDKHAPLTKVPKRKINYIFKPWITKDILPHIIAKNKVAANRHKNPEQFKKMRNHVNNIIDKSKNSYFKKYFSEHSKNAKKVWEGVRCAIEWKRSNSNSIASITDNYGQTVTDPASIAQAFANHFKEIPQNSVSKIRKGSTKTDYTNYLKNSNCSSMVFFDADDTEVYNIINSLKSNKSPGPLNFSNHLIKLLSSHLSPILCRLINRSYKESCMPSCLKIGKQTPIFKGGDNLIANYRPITVVNSIAKIFEKSVSPRLVNFLERFDILTDNQFGFRSRHGTSHAMIKLFDEALSALDDKQSKAGTVLLDISKAFDCVNHDILLDKLYHYGIRGSVLDWFKSFLTNRTHYVDINGSKYKPYIPTMGVPQGSVLGPILFLIYINDLRNSSNTLSFSIFADDTSLFLSSIRDFYYEIFINELNKVTEWFSSNKLLLNYSKSQYIFFGPLYQTVYESEFMLSDLYEVCPHFLLLDNSYSCLEEQLEDTSIKRKYVRGDPILKDLHLVAPDYLCKEYIITNNGILVEQNEVKYLGITADNTLSFSTHINQITQKISKVVGILWEYLSISSLRSITI